MEWTEHTERTDALDNAPVYHKPYSTCALYGFTYDLRGWSECNCWPTVVPAVLSYPADDLGRPVVEPEPAG